MSRGAHAAATGECSGKLDSIEVEAIRLVWHEIQGPPSMYDDDHAMLPKPSMAIFPVIHYPLLGFMFHLNIDFRPHEA